MKYLLLSISCFVVGCGTTTNVTQGTPTNLSSVVTCSTVQILTGSASDVILLEYKLANYSTGDVISSAMASSGSEVQTVNNQSYYPADETSLSIDVPYVLNDNTASYSSCFFEFNENKGTYSVSYPCTKWTHTFQQNECYTNK